MAKGSKPQRIAGYPVERLAVGKHSLGQIVISDDVTVVFRMADGGGSGGGSSAACLSCRISKISQCAALVCPDIKKADPNASCSDAIKECTLLACRGSCGSAAFGDGILVIA